LPVIIADYRHIVKQKPDAGFEVPTGQAAGGRGKKRCEKWEKCAPTVLPASKTNRGGSKVETNPLASAFAKGFVG